MFETSSTYVNVCSQNFNKWILSYEAAAFSRVYMTKETNYDWFVHVANADTASVESGNSLDRLALTDERHRRVECLASKGARMMPGHSIVSIQPGYKISMLGPRTVETVCALFLSAVERGLSGEIAAVAGGSCCDRCVARRLGLCISCSIA